MSPASPPPPGAPAAYQPPSGYPPAPGYAPAATTVRIPAWLDFGVLISLIGGILVLVGFFYGNGAVLAQASTPPSASTYESDLEAFFVWSGVGIFLAILGWVLHVMLPLFLKSRKPAAPAGYAAPMAAPIAAPPMTPDPAPMAAPAAAPMAAAPAVAQPMAAGAPVTPGAPNCANCGRPTTYIAQYGRYYCYACSRYV
jgi:hypothetical protein